MRVINEFDMINLLVRGGLEIPNVVGEYLSPLNFKCLCANIAQPSLTTLREQH